MRLIRYIKTSTMRFKVRCFPKNITKLATMRRFFVNCLILLFLVVNVFPPSTEYKTSQELLPWKPAYNQWSNFSKAVITDDSEVRVWEKCSKQTHIAMVKTHKVCISFSVVESYCTEINIEYYHTVVIATEKLSNSEAKPRCYDNFKGDNNRVIIFLINTYCDHFKVEHCFLPFLFYFL